MDERVRSNKKAKKKFRDLKKKARSEARNGGSIKDGAIKIGKKASVIEKGGINVAARVQKVVENVDETIG